VSEQQEKPGNPVVSGLVALLAVGLTVGLVLGGVALVVTELVGVGDTETASADSTQRESLYLPKPQKTKGSGPQITLQTEDTNEPSDDETDDPATETSEPTKTKSPDEVITLQAGQTEVANFGQIDLSGVYPGGEGAVLQVQRFENGRWVDFDATISVSNETFSSYVQTGVTGMNRFRVFDPSTGTASNEVRVSVLP